MKQGRFYVASALALSLYSLSGCAADGTTGGSSEDNKPVGDWGDETKYPEIGGAYHSLVALTTAPVFATGTLTVTPDGTTGETVVIGKRSIDSAILVNGLPTGATATTMKKLVIKSAAPGTADHTVILDFLGGVFGAGTTSARGIEIDLGAGTSGHTLGIRGSTGNDVFAMGTDGIATNTDNYRDIDVNFTNVKMSFALAAGNDTFVATAGGKGVAGNAALDLTVYGGDGNDIITGGDKNDALFGGAGNDTLFGGAVGAGGFNTLSGEAGLDTIAQGDAPNGADRIHCGTEAVPDPLKPVLDVVSYEKRGNVDPRDATDADPTMALAQAIASDGESVNVTVGGTACTTNTGACAACTDADTDNTCDPLDAFGLAQYPADDGDEDETGSTVDANNVLVGTKAVVENDMIAPDCESIVGSMDNDTLTGDGNANTLSGNAGMDALVGMAGDDVLNGDADDDLLDESTTAKGAGKDVLNGGAGTDTVTYASRAGALTVTMDGAAADDGEGGSTEGDNVKADVENLVGGGGGDTITGNNANNVLTGGAGIDTLSGGGGDDVFEEGTAANGGDTFNGGAGTDTVNYGARLLAVTVTMDGVAANDGDTAGNEGDNVKSDVENCNGGAGVDSITGNESINIINGGAGADTLLSGLGGEDQLDGEAGGAVTVNGGTGDDICLNATTKVACELPN